MLIPVSSLHRLTKSGLHRISHKQIFVPTQLQTNLAYLPGMPNSDWLVVRGAISLSDRDIGQIDVYAL